MIRPERLNTGDKVAAVSLSFGGPGMYPYRYEAGKRQLEEEFGLQVIERPQTLRDPDWLDRNPKARAYDLMEAFLDDSIKGIISTIGGEDSIRLIPYLDLDLIHSHPKVFLGYSDTTVTHLACYKAGVCSFYGPSIMAGFAENSGMFPYMVDSVRKTLFQREPVGLVEQNTHGWTAEYLHWAHPENQKRKRRLNPSAPWRYLQGEGSVKGPLFGGCLEVLHWLPGTPIWPRSHEWEGLILFLETSEEAPPPSQVTRFLRSLAAMGILERISGILFGRPGGDIPVSDFDQYDDALRKVVSHEEGLTDLPIISRMDFGHTDPMFILPYGVLAEIDCDKEEFSILESGVL